MITYIALVLFGLLLLIGGGELLLRGAVGLARLLRVTPAVIGLTVVAAGTSVPELAVTMLATFQGKEAVGIGNVVGSNIFNVALILGLAALIRPLAISGNTIKLEYPVLLLVTFLFYVVSSDGTIGHLEASLFVAVYIAFTSFLVCVVRKQMNQVEVTEFGNEVAELVDESAGSGGSWAFKCVGLVVLGIVLLVGGAQSTVSGAVELGKMIGMSESVIGLTIVAAGTGLPEVVTSIVSSVRGRDDVAIGNVIGSNLFNILGTLGISGLIQVVPVPVEMIRFDNIWLLGSTLLLFPIIFTGRRITRWEGAVLFGSYVLYLGILLSRPTTA